MVYRPMSCDEFRRIMQTGTVEEVISQSRMLDEHELLCRACLLFMEHRPRPGIADLLDGLTDQEAVPDVFRPFLGPAGN